MKSSRDRNCLRRTAIWACALAFVMLRVPAFAQRNSQQQQCLANYVEIQIRVTDDQDRPAGQMIRVELLNESNVPIQQRFTDSEGQTKFQVSSIGDFHARATGGEIEETVSESITVICGDRSKMQFLHVKPKQTGTASVSIA